jgi:tetratricopeptide (TPR) repeat protein
MEALLRVDYDQAEAWYAAMSATEGQGASLAAYGRADILLARGDRDAAATLLAEGAAADDAVEDGSGATMKRLALARAQLGAGDRGAVEATLGQVRDIESADRHEVEWAELQVALGKTEEAQSVANRLAAKVSAQSRAYAEYVRGTAHAAAGDHLGAVEALTRSIAVRDTWLARSARGVAYLQAGYAVEATDELDLAWRRRGEGIAVFLDDTPSYLRIVELHYWRGRAREAGGMTEAAIEAYEQFLKVRDRADRDSNVLDARQRLQALRDATK